MASFWGKADLSLGWPRKIPPLATAPVSSACDQSGGGIGVALIPQDVALLR